jgi:hypothetical protein
VGVAVCFFFALFAALTRGCEALLAGFVQRGGAGVALLGSRAKLNSCVKPWFGNHKPH